ncbi:hypothetical protein [Mesorhizobium sp. M0040]|uniref:hypothetical protein n=1 Tax=Mesorhizobium sp. M0040 TaxID=2956855 RepID=UPI003335D663
MSWDEGWKDADAKLSAQFAETVGWLHNRDLSTIAKDRDFVGRQLALPPSVIQATKARFSNIMSTVRAVEKTRAEVRSDRAMRGDTSKRTVRIIDQKDVAEGVRHVFLSHEVLDAASVQHLISHNINQDYTLDRSVPSMSLDEPYELGFAEVVPSYFGDPEKLVRAAAFAGWVILKPESGDLLTQVARHLSSKRKRSENIG